MRKYILLGIFLILTAVLSLLFFQTKPETSKNAAPTSSLKIVTTLFPLYDFAKNIGQEKVTVSLLLPPGVESHSFEPKPSDIAEINSADIFVYTGDFMEPWANDISKGINKRTSVVDASMGVKNLQKEHEENKTDPHIWLDFENAKIMAANIAGKMMEIDPQNASFYQENLRAYQIRIDNMDKSYHDSLLDCRSRSIVHGGHYTFGYLASRYGLSYVSAQGFMPDSEPTAKDLIALVDQIRRDKIIYIFYEELSSQKIADTLAKETSAQMLLLNGAHNLSKEDYQSGISFLDIMGKNLENLIIGLNCKK